jgi:2-polyprenyl-3-methyl-5-hydroxy-6-metoxy-1,4-benzoquinol methylase
MDRPEPSQSSGESQRETRDQAFFDQIARGYSEKDTRPAMREPRRLRLIQTLNQVQNLAELSLLEVGCGAGFAARYLEGNYKSYHGIDYSRALIAYAEKYNKTDAASFAVTNVKDLPTESAYDVIFMIGVLHHIDDIPTALRHLRSVLKPGGWLLANEPQSGNRLFSALRRARKKLDAAYSEEQIELSRSEAHRLFEETGLSDVTVRGQGLFSTPFAEVKMPLQPLAKVAAAASCGLDRTLERMLPNTILGPACWNLIVSGRNPEA